MAFEMRKSRIRRSCVGGIAALLATSCCYGDVELGGVLGNKAVLIIDGGPPKILAVGERTAGGMRLLEVSRESALIEVDGRPQRLILGSSAVRIGDSASRPATVGLVADSKGHHFSMGSINGASVRFLVDTGASMVSMSAADARRAGVDYMRGRQTMTETANGPAKVWRVTLDSVRLGDIVLEGVEGMVVQNDLPFVLLGMSFLSRMDMQREGERLVLRKRY
jgi:aspartyl protease family protein